MRPRVSRAPEDAVAAVAAVAADAAARTGTERRCDSRFERAGASGSSAHHDARGSSAAAAAPAAVAAWRATRTAKFARSACHIDRDCARTARTAHRWRGHPGRQHRYIFPIPAAAAAAYVVDSSAQKPLRVCVPTATAWARWRWNARSAVAGCTAGHGQRQRHSRRAWTPSLLPSPPCPNCPDGSAERARPCWGQEPPPPRSRAGPCGTPRARLRGAGSLPRGSCAPRCATATRTRMVMRHQRR